MSNLVSTILKAGGAVVCAVAVVVVTIVASNTLLIDTTLNKNAITVDPNAPGAQISKNKLPDPILELIADADTIKGAKIARACAACHNFEKGAAAKQGPTLWNIVNRKRAGMSGFEYSEAMASQNNPWTYDELNLYLTKPKKYIPGTKMNFAGLRKAEDRAALIAWLREQADAPAPLPSAADIAAELKAREPAE